MDIRFIRKSMGKQSIDDMTNIMKDLILKSDISSINNFSELKQYHTGDKVYIKDGKIHRIYVCKVANSTVGKILDNEWKDIFLSFKVDWLNNQIITDQGPIGFYTEIQFLFSNIPKCQIVSIFKRQNTFLEHLFF